MITNDRTTSRIRTSLRRLGGFALPAVATGVLMLGACADHPVAPRKASPTGAAARASVSVQPSRQALRTVDDRLLELAQQIPGFGGLAFDDDGAVRVSLVDLSRAEQARPIIVTFMQGRGRSESGPGVGAAPLRFVRARFNWSQLVSWKNGLRQIVFALPGVVSLDADEGQNRIAIGVAPEADTARVRRAIARLDLPVGAVDFVRDGETELLQSTLRQPYSPRIGGLGISSGAPIPSGQLQDCTHGPRIYWGANGGFLTNSHCTGGLSGAFVMQSLSMYQAGQFIGTEVRDEPLFENAYACPSGRWCRNSDAAIVEYTTGINKAFGIAFTGLPQCNGWTSCEGRLGIQGIVEVTADDYVLQNEQVNKTGQRSGWTRGAVTQTCIDRDYDPIYWAPAGGLITPLLLCQIYFGGFADGGDSGSPVYKRYTFTSGTPGYAIVVGLLWGRSNAIQTSFASSLNGISADLGGVTVYP